MIPFIVLLLVPIIIQHVRIDGIDYGKKNDFAMFFFFALLAILVMLRHETVGNDTRNYIYFFENISKTEWRDFKVGSLEIGFLYFNKIISLLSENSRFFLIIAAGVVNALIYPTYKRLCTDTSLTIVLFCITSIFVMMFSGMRQMLAIGIGFVAYNYTRKKKPVPFIVSVLLAMTFHTSAFMLIFMYPLYHARITKKKIYIIAPVLALVFLYNQPIFSALAMIIERYTKYEGSITETGAYTMLILFSIFAIFSFVIPEEETLNDEIIGLRNFLLFALMIQIFAPLHFLAMRMNYYYIIFIPLLIPKIIEHRSDRWNQVAIVARHVMVIFFLLYFFLKAKSGPNLHVFPYHFFWENF